VSLLNPSAADVRGRFQSGQFDVEFFGGRRLELWKAYLRFVQSMVCFDLRVDCIGSRRRSARLPMTSRRPEDTDD
jgi:hypothetical protein